MKLYYDPEKDLFTLDFEKGAYIPPVGKNAIVEFDESAISDCGCISTFAITNFISPFDPIVTSEAALESISFWDILFRKRKTIERIKLNL